MRCVLRSSNFTFKTLIAKLFMKILSHVFFEISEKTEFVLILFFTVQVVPTTQHAEWDLNKIEKTFNETFTG